jgi:glycosyltransferase involved in cell wall biosynthesis
VTPRVSLALPVCNGERFIASAVQSIVDQSFTDFELIITDNASADATQGICRAFAARDTRIRYVRNERNLGAAGNFNLGFKLATGEFFKWCAHDDLISASFIEECVCALDANRNDVLAYGRQQGIDEHGDLIPWVSSEASDLHGFDAARRFRMVYKVQGFDAAMFGLIRREALAQTSLHRSYYGSDIALLAELALLGPFQRLPQITFYNREHGTRSINITDKRVRQAWHDPQFVARPIPENVALLHHLATVADKHRRVAPLWRTGPDLLAWAATPHQLARYGLEIIGLASPPLQGHLRRLGQQALRALRGDNAPNQSQQER